jgi:hypothetical protein
VLKGIEDALSRGRKPAEMAVRTAAFTRAPVSGRTALSRSLVF